VDITRAAIEKNRITVAILVIVLVGGWNAFNSLPRAEDPGFTIRTAQVITSFPGASPERVEDLITDRLEKAIRELPELESIESVSKTGISIITVNVQERYTEMRPIWDSLRRKVEREAASMPDGAESPTVNDEFGDVFGIVLALTGDGFSYAELKEIADEMRSELLRLEDTGKVEIFGTQEERIFIEFQNSRLTQLGVAPLELSNILEAQNIVTPGGSIRLGPERIVVEPSGNFESIEDVGTTIVPLPDSEEVLYLRDLVSVSRGYIDPPSSKVHTGSGAIRFHSRNLTFPGDEPRTAALALAISMREGGLLTELGKRVDAEVDRFNETYPIGIQIDKVVFQPYDVQEVVDGFTSNLLQAVAVVMGAMLLFLGARTGLVVSALIPTAMMATLFVMQLVGIGLDQISLAALIIALGMLVDNGVVMAESIMVQMEAGQSGKDAAIRSARELRIPLLTSSLTTSAAFLPIFLAESATGEYTAALFKVVTIALLASWLLALTMTPLLCSALLRVDVSSKGETFDGPFYRRYRGALLALLRRPIPTLTGVVFVFGLTLYGAGKVPALFFPPSDRPGFEVELTLPEGTDIEYTRKVVQKLEGFMVETLIVEEDRPEGIINWATFIGQGAPRYYLSYGPEPRNPAYAIMLVDSTSQEARDEAMSQIRHYLAENHPEVKPGVNPRQLGPPVSHPVQIRLTGIDTEKLFGIVDDVKSRIREIPGAMNVGDDWGKRTKKILITVDQARARSAGATSQDVAISLQTIFSGLEVTQYREEEKVIPVTMRTEEEERLDLDRLETVSIYAQASGMPVALGQIATGEVVWEPSKILRRNSARSVSVVADVAEGTLASDVTNVLRPWLVEQSSGWPIGYRFEIAGEEEAASKANASIGAKLPIAGGIIVLLLVMQFNSLRRPLIILLTVPLGLTGVVVGLLLARSYFGFMTLLGVISLFGIVINNAIVLIDRIGIEIEENERTPAEAVLSAAQTRLRPILLTTATTILGLVPLWLGGGPMWEPMAIAIIFGLGFATVLTLGVVPCLYAVFFRVDFEGVD